MKNLRLLLSLCSAILFLINVAFSQSTGDYRSNPTGVAPYLWTSVSNWQIYNADSAKWLTATGTPSSTNNVTVLTGDTISLTSNIAQCARLTVESGGVLQSNNLAISSPMTLRVFGTSVTINGILGKASGDGIALETAGPSGNTLTLSGSGTVNISTVKMNTTHNTIVFGMNVNLYNAGSDGKEGYGLQINKDSAAVTINAGYSVAFAQNSGLSFTSSQDSVAVTATININGTLDLSQSGSNMILKCTTGDSATLNINSGGSVTVGGNFLTTDVNDKGKPTTITINGTGSLTCKGITDFSNPGMKVTGTGSFTLSSGASLYIGDAAGITSSGSTGTIQATTRTFNANANYAYMDTVAQVTGNALPSNVRGFIVNNKNGVTISNSLTVDTILTFTNGKLTLGSNNLILSQSGTLQGGSGTSYAIAEGSGVFTRNSVGTNNILFAVGTSSSYNPVIINNSGTVDNFSLRLKSSFDNAPSDPTKVVNRQWTITEAVVGGSNATLKFQWNSGDQASSFDPNGSVAISRYAAGWQDVGAVVTGVDPYIASANGFSSFSNFIIQNSSLPSYRSIASLDFGGVINGTSKPDSFYVKNIGTSSLNISLASSDNARFTVLPTSAAIAGGDSGKFKITFSPLAIGPLTGHIIFAHNAAGSPDSTTVTGIGLQSGATFYASSGIIDFGKTTQIFRTKKDSVTIINTGTANLTIDSIRTRLSGQYSVTESGPYTLISTESKIIHLLFSPTDSSTQNGALVFFSNASTTPDTVSLTGNGQGVIVYSAGTLSGGSAWSNTSTWQGGGIPTNYDSVIILGTDSVYLSTIDTCYGVRILAGGKLALAAKLKVANMIVDGTVIVSADTLRPTDSLIVGSTGTYRHALNGGRIPTAYWADGSTCEFTGLTSTSPGNTFQSFYNIIMNSSGITSNLNIGWHPSSAGGDTSITIRGSITTRSTGAARWQMCAPPIGAADDRTVARVTINGNIVVSGGTFTATGTGNSYTDIIITVNGNVNVTGSGSQLSISRGSQGGTGTCTWYMKGDVSYGPATANQNSTEPGTDSTTLVPRGKFVFCKNGTQTVTLDSTIAWTGRCNMQFGDGTTPTIVNIGNSPFIGSATIQRIMPNAKVIIGPDGYIGGGTNGSNVKSKFYMEDGGTMVLASQSGIRATDHGSSGAVRVSGLRNYGTNGNFEYNGTQRQRLGSGLPASLRNLVINNTIGVYADTLTAFTVNDTLAINTCNLALDSSACVATLGPSATLIEGEGHSCHGSLAVTRKVNADVDETFKGIGLTLHATGIAPDTTTVTRIAGVAQAGDTTHSILRAYDISPKINTGLNASMTFTYYPSELNGQDASQLLLWKSLDGGLTWIYRHAGNDPVNHRLTASGITSFSRWTASDIYHPIGSMAHQLIVNSSWNMVSIPYTFVNYNKTALFPTAISDAFAFEGTYVSKDVLMNMIGYWLKFAAKETIYVNGSDRFNDSVSVTVGWNMIGSVSVPIQKLSIISDPPGIVTSDYFGYDGSYLSQDTIMPFKGYWVKTNDAGKLYLNGATRIAKGAVTTSDIVRQFNTITITDAKGNHQTLYFGKTSNEKVIASMFEVPPKGPEEMFDVRFGSQQFAEIIPTNLSTKQSHQISIQAPVYPLTIAWHIVDDASLSYALQFNHEKNTSLSGDGKLVVPTPVKTMNLEINGTGPIPTEFSLGNNYPNPFNPTTKFVVGVPSAATVEIVVYDILGRKIRTLFNKEMSAGYKTVEWNGLTDDNVPASSGIYFVRMISEKFNAVQKIMMMK